MARAVSKKQASQYQFKDYYIGVMLFIITGIMPLAVRGIKVDAPPETQALLGGQYYYDFLAYLKSWLVLIPAGLTVFYFISELATGGIKNVNFKKIFKDPMIIAVLVFLFMSLLSSVFSKYSHTAFLGTYERFEGFIMLFSYMTVFITAFFYLREEKYMLPVLAGLIFSSIIMGSIGVGKFLGYDVFTTDLAKALITASDGQGFSVQFDIAFATLYNPNTYGLYSSMMFPFLLLCGFTYDGKKWINGLMLLAGLLMLGGIAASNSLGGLLGAVAAVAVLLITYIATLIYNKKKPPRAASVSLLTAAAVLVLVLLFVPPVRSRMAGFADKFMSSMTVGSDEKLPNYKTDGNAFVIEDGNGQRQVTLEFGGGQWPAVLDGNGSEVPYENIPPNDNDKNPYKAQISYDVPGYGSLKLGNFESKYALYIKFSRADKPLVLSYTEGKLNVLISNSGEIVDINAPVDSIGFKDRERWATMRGYIWSRSLPLMFKYPIIGSGPDSFINVFPQHDVAGKLRVYNEPYIIVDKAHNLYLQTWITTGGISALAFIFLLGCYLLNGFLSLVKSKGENRFQYGLRLGLLAGISAFCVSSMATDSTVGSSGVFYILLALGYASNLWAKKRAEEPTIKIQ